METKCYVIRRTVSWNHGRNFSYWYIKGVSSNALDSMWNETSSLMFAKAYPTKEEAHKVLARIEEWEGVRGKWEVVEDTKEHIRDLRREYYELTNQKGR